MTFLFLKTKLAHRFGFPDSVIGLYFMNIGQNSQWTQTFFEEVKREIKPLELGEYILNELSTEDQEKILKRIAVDKLLSHIAEKECNPVVVPFSPEERSREAKRIKNEILFYLALSRFKGTGNAVIRKLLKQFKSLENIFHAQVSELRGKGVPLSIIKAITDASEREKALDRACETLNVCRQEGIHLLYLESEYYPDEFLEDDTMPFLVFYKGDISFLKRERKIALFGKKYASEFGMRAVHSLTGAIVSEGYTVVTDAFTTIGTQSTFVSIQNSAPPIVVFPCSLNHAATKTRRRFINHVLDSGGLVLSLLAPGEPYSYRNIITSGKCRLLLSGAMILIESDQNLAASQFVTAAKRFRKPIIVPVPPRPYASINENIVLLLKNDPDVLPIHSRDEYFKIFNMLEKHFASFRLK